MNWALAVALHALWWAWIAPNLRSRVRVKYNNIWAYFWWIPYVTTLGLIIWPFIAIDRLQGWSPIWSKTIVETICVFLLVSSLIFGYLSAVLLRKSDAKHDEIIAAQWAYGRIHALRKCYENYCGYLWIAAVIGSVLVYSFVIELKPIKKANEPSVAIVAEYVPPPRKIQTPAQDIQKADPAMAKEDEIKRYYSNTQSSAKNMMTVNTAPQNNQISQNAAANIPANSDSVSQIIGPDGNIIEGQIITAAPTQTSVSPTQAQSQPQADFQITTEDPKNLTTASN